ncbi:MAG: ATP synthase F1 subunit gamma [Candidatus Omnitrophica bacterium]|nr:ATP synthase F1 subunit gamma [Candidatus Omnitrophota bacterium]
MASLRQLRQRLRSIQSTKQIMRAMQLVSGSKLKRAQGRLLQARSVMGFLDGLLERVLTAAPEMTHPLCRAREGSPSCLVLFTSDAGLCGSYNTNLIQLAESFLRRDTLNGTRVIYIGKKGYRYFTKRGYAAAEAYLDLAGRPNLAKAEAIAQALMSRFLNEEVSAVHLLYSQFVSSAAYRPTILQWLPIQLDSSKLVSSKTATTPTAVEPSSRRATAALEYIFEPSPQRIFEDLMPRWALAKFQLVMLEAFTSEHSARMIAMKNATDNAEELLKALTLQRNKIRQASITKEISEIVGTAEALK